MRGRCFGGGFELALACDFILAAEDAAFATAGDRPRCVPASGVRAAAARESALARGRAQPDDRRDNDGARSGSDAGSSQLLAAPGTLDTWWTRWFAAHLAPRSAAALRHGRCGDAHGLQSHVRTVLPEIERLYLDDLMRTHDAVEGIAAFMDAGARLSLDGPNYDYDDLRCRDRVAGSQLRGNRTPDAAAAIRRSGRKATWRRCSRRSCSRSTASRIPTATDRHVSLRGFSWIVEPAEGGVVIAIEIPTRRRGGGPIRHRAGHASIGLITRVLAAAQPKAVVH